MDIHVCAEIRNIKSCTRKWFAVQRPYIHVFFRPPARKRSLVFGFAVWQMMSGSRGIEEIYLTLRRSDTVISAWACRGIDECIVGAYDDAYTWCPCRMLYCWCVTCTVRVYWCVVLWITYTAVWSFAFCLRVWLLTKNQCVLRETQRFA